MGETVFKLKVSGPLIFVSLLVERYNLVGLWFYDMEREKEALF